MLWTDTFVETTAVNSPLDPIVFKPFLMVIIYSCSVVDSYEMFFSV